nr:15067_t:CDS:2 [Entrophospora candida]
MLYKGITTGKFKLNIKVLNTIDPNQKAEVNINHGIIEIIFKKLRFQKDVHKEIASKVELGCKIPPPNVVLLKPAIFRRTKTYHNENLTERFILGQWHTSKSMANALITAFSGYAIYNIATALGVRF